MSDQKNEKVPVIGYIALIFAILFFSGLLPSIATNINKKAITSVEAKIKAGEINAEDAKQAAEKAAKAGLWINAFDFGKLQGKFGDIIYYAPAAKTVDFTGVTVTDVQVAKDSTITVKGVTDTGEEKVQSVSFGKKTTSFRGGGGKGARDGFIFALTLVPSVMFALGFIEVVANYGGLKAAQKLLTPLLRPLLGIPGVAGLALISSLQSTDAGASMTKALRESGDISEKEKTVFSMFQFSAGATVTNFLSSGAAIIVIVDKVMPTIVVVSFVVMFVLKIFGANLMRFAVIKMMGGENE